jgi:hypothetical protein
MGGGMLEWLYKEKNEYPIFHTSITHWLTNRSKRARNKKRSALTDLYEI